MAGRPTKYSKERAERFIQAVQIGATYRAASAAAGVAEDTTQLWRTQFPAFAAAVKDAEQLREVSCLSIIRKAATKGQWTAAAWILERTNPQTYGRRTRIDGPVQLEGHVKVSVASSDTYDGLSTEALERLAGEDSGGSDAVGAGL